jgi:DNA polymerase elongation subunit (family B)
MNIIKSKIVKIEQLDDFADEYVYDIGIKGDTPYFFGNDILVHNSSYFSCHHIRDTDFFKTTYPNFIPTKENYIKLYDDAALRVNKTFPPFMDTHFNTTIERGNIIAAGREIVALKALFIKKKKYACLLYDKEGERLDINGKPGKIKAMGLDLKRADTNRLMQKFLEEILMDILTGCGEQKIIEKIKSFRNEYKKLKSWEMGTPKKVNGFTKYKDKINESMIGHNSNIFKIQVKEKKVMVPGHVRASINWNKLCDFNNDHYSTRITDGGKVVVCYLQKNIYNITSIAFPIDQIHLPDWFKQLPFDHQLMIETNVDKKVNNLLDVLGWDLQKTKDDNTFDDLFTF